MHRKYTFREIVEGFEQMGPFSRSAKVWAEKALTETETLKADPDFYERQFQKRLDEREDWG